MQISCIDRSHPQFSHFKRQMRQCRFQFAYDIGGELLIWVDGNNVVAYVVLIDDGIELMEVVPGRQGQGIGTRIVTELKTERPNLWRSGNSHSDRALKFWESVGLRQ